MADPDLKSPFQTNLNCEWFVTIAGTIFTSTSTNMSYGIINTTLNLCGLLNAACNMGVWNRQEKCPELLHL